MKNGGMQPMQRYAEGMHCRGRGEALGGYACICTLLRRDCIAAYPLTLPQGRSHPAGRAMDDPR